MSRFLLANANSEPTGALSLREDDMATRNVGCCHFTKEARFSMKKLNGNVASILVPGQDDDDGPKDSPFAKLNTSTSTTFKDEFYTTHSSISDKLSSPSSKSYVMKLTGHKSMDVLSPTDPRQQYVKPNPQVGPGSYETDGTWSHTTGTAPRNPHTQETRHSMPFEKDPFRPSPAFKATSRDTKAVRLYLHTETSAIPLMHNSDDNAWVRHGASMSKTPHVIPVESWGTGGRWLRPQPPAIVTPEDPSSPTTYSSYASAPTSPAHHAVFHSGLPRLVALPGGKRAETRVLFKTPDRLGTSAELGPGCYAQEAPRLTSFHAAYSGAKVYHSLASASLLPHPDLKPLQHKRITGFEDIGHSGLGLCSSTAALSTASEPCSPVSRNSLKFLRSFPSFGGAGAADLQEGTTADLDWALHQAAIQFCHVRDGPPLSEQQQQQQQQQQGVEGPDGLTMEQLLQVRGAHARKQQESQQQACSQQSAFEAGLHDDNELDNLKHTFQRRSAGAFDGLVFARRAVSYNKLIHTRLSVQAAVQQARAEVRAAAEKP